MCVCVCVCVYVCMYVCKQIAYDLLQKCIANNSIREKHCK